MLRSRAGPGGGPAARRLANLANHANGAEAPAKQPATPRACTITVSYSPAKGKRGSPPLAGGDGGGYHHLRRATPDRARAAATGSRLRYRPTRRDGAAAACCGVKSRRRRRQPGGGLAQSLERA